MAVYTKLTRSQISTHLTNYSLGKLIDFQEIIEGIDNSNFIIKTTGGADSRGDNKFILTIFESRINKKDLPFFINFKEHLAKNKIHCPRPILDNKGEAIVDLQDKKSTIVTFLSGKNLQPQDDGYYSNITAQHCFEVGSMLGKMHLVAQDFAMQRKNDLGVEAWSPLFSKFKDREDFFNLAKNLSNSLSQKNLKQEIADALIFLEKAWRFDLPSSAAHLDLFPDNVFFDENQKASGVIDFYFAANDVLIYDFAIVVNAWCFDEKNNFLQEKFLALKNGYENFRKFSPKEIDFLEIALCGAAMRFLLTRLHDKIFTPKSSLVKIKDPQEYIIKLQFFKNKLNFLFQKKD